MRLFLAINIPEALALALHTVQRQLTPYVSATYPKTFHLTIKFFGEAEPETVKFALKNIQFESFDLSLSKFGTFNHRVAWVGTTMPPHLLLLAENIKNATAQWGDDKPFASHITMARIKSVNNTEEFQKFLRLPVPEFSWQVRQVILYESKLTPQGPMYKPQEVLTAKNL